MLAPEPTTSLPDAAASTGSNTATMLPAIEQRPFVRPELGTNQSTLGPGGPIDRLERVEVKTQGDFRGGEESDVARALLRQASRQYFHVPKLLRSNFARLIFRVLQTSRSLLFCGS